MATCNRKWGKGALHDICKIVRERRVRALANIGSGGTDGELSGIEIQDAEFTAFGGGLSEGGSCIANGDETG